MIIHYQNEVSISKKTHWIHMEDYSVPIESSNKLKIQSVVLSVIMFNDGSNVCNKKVKSDMIQDFEQLLRAILKTE